MRPLREGAPGREDEIGRVKVQVIIEVEPFHAREHHLATGESHHRRLQQGGGDGVRGNRIALILPLLLRAQQRPGDQGIAIGGVVFIGDRVRRHRVIAPVKQPVRLVAQGVVRPLPQLVERRTIVIRHRQEHGEALTFRMRHIAIGGINDTTIRHHKTGLIALPGRIRPRPGHQHHYRCHYHRH